ncbi:MAG: methenyltetrahydromethanopterin cyclohydrolase [Planctomycetaceae bacterium]|nr:methenyltetrahydromethanopterin cyclohydrolase [Planctomycetaceae bacterium]
MKLNDRAKYITDTLIDLADDLKIASSSSKDGTNLIDLGASVIGGLEAGRLLAEVCLAGLAHVSYVASPNIFPTTTAVQIDTDHPVQACMASQYAGWQLATDDYFGMGSGPMRAAAGKETLFSDIGFTEQAAHIVGVIESKQAPTASVCKLIADECGVSPNNLTIAFAPTSSLAGTVQVVARSLETALHKMHELGFDLARVQAGTGLAPLPPVAGDDLVGIGLTNDAILYGGEVSIWITGDDESIEAIGNKIPSGASKDYGKPFLEIFKEYDHDFYKIDPHLFSPAVININNLETGRYFRFGRFNSNVLEHSFGLS